MYCQKCGVHFSGRDTKGCCPYCGLAGAPTQNAEKSSPVDDSQSIGADPERTRTEADAVDLWSPGSVVAGKYEIVHRLGSGGFGTVYKVRHIFRKKYYALKTPHAEFTRDEVFRRRFEREIEAMERFVHGDAVMIRDSGLTEDGRPYYTMDFIEGESLKAVLAREGRLPAGQALDIVLRILNVLDVAHAHDIIHRDIKPDNILLTRTGGREAVKVVDFGVAKLLDLIGETASITHGDRIGTPKYMSPEQVTGEAVEARSDIFSLGIVFYEMVTGEHPFAQVRDPIRITAAILNRDPPAPKDLVPDLPRAVNDLILCMLEKKVKRRPGSAAAVLKQLRGITREVTRVESVTRWKLVPDVPRAPTVPLVLRQGTSAGERRCFVLFDERVFFGRSHDLSRGLRNHLLLRCLPCRSQVLDAENWRRSLTISHVVGSIQPDGAAVVIEPAPNSTHGISVGGVRSHRTARLQADRFAISLGDQALDLDGFRHLRSREDVEVDLSFLQEGRPPGLEPSLLTGFSNRSCHIDAVSFFRTNNWPLHEYYLVYRTLRLGSSARAPLRLRGAGVAATHAAIIADGGEAFLLAIDDDVHLTWREDDDRGTGGQGPPRCELVLPPGTMAPLRPRSELRIGDNHVFVEQATDDYFKTT